MPEACEVAVEGMQKFPQDDAIRNLWMRCDSVPAAVRN
jgi:hypothetical protein